MAKQAGLVTPRKKFNAGEVRSNLIKNLEGMCYFLISQGHNNEFRNPFSYPFKELVKAYERTHAIYSQNIANKSIAHQAAIIGTNSQEGGKYFQEYIKKLTEQ
ncbi:hypothetical protein HNO53_12900 [Billgrantia antri]|uniref:Uncharacterized protein n=1 Tax=Halomonas sulfidivorans TaxID=2733488 RepID=A0ABX7WL15_9GAMM|nr:hypothetical protein [Halomonas sulfidivorans]QTP59534.1 hypothetical protein HNO53_12900 [Halomonas sulfidivorans]